MENNKEQNILKRSSRKLIIFEIVCVALIIGLIGYTYSFFNVTATNDSVIYGEAASVNLSLEVEKLAPSTNKGLVPQLDDYITSAVIGRNGSCVDDNNNNVCQVYKITVTNSGSAVHVNGTLKLDAKNNPNLKWAIISGTTNPTLVSSASPYTYTKLIENELYNSNQSKDYYIVLWISETGVMQTDQGGFTGVVTVGDTESVELPTVSKSSLAMLGLTENDTVLTTFTNTSKNDGTTGIYKAEDDLGESYYFRGNVTNNYVKFAGFYWRIIRINGDGSIRMIYDGTSAHANNEESTDRQIGTSAYNTNYNDNTYVGYKYGTAGSSTYEATHANTNDSTIKTSLDNWYNNNIKGTTDEQYVADAIYCNDRTRVTDTDKMTELDEYWVMTSTGEGYGTKVTYYGFLNRTAGDNSSVTPSLKCEQLNDKFTKSSSLGNGKLDNPIGLITLDEMVYAGSYLYMDDTSVNDETYLYNGSNWYWSMSPFVFYGGHANVGYGDEEGAISGYNVRNSRGAVRAVISLSSGALKYGNGTSINPYRVNSSM